MRLGLFGFLIVACQTCVPSHASPLAPTAMSHDIAEKTLAKAQVSSTLSDIDLASIVLQPGDLPSGYVGTKTKDRAPAAFKKLPKAKKIIDQRIKKGKEIIGGVTIFLYETSEEVERAYLTILKGFGKPGNDTVTRSAIWAIPDIGERATISKFEVIIEMIRHYFKSFELAFTRCHAVVNIQLDEINPIIAYAKKLDQRILNSACR
jgi:hypothetical protein